MIKPNDDEYASFYAGYVNLVTSADGLSALKISQEELRIVLSSIPEGHGSYRYAEGKWSVNQLLLHLIDSEVIFTNRALRIARGDQSPLPGFNQDYYVSQSMADYQSLQNLIELFTKTRALTIALLTSFPMSCSENMGIVDGNKMSVRALCFIISGHTIHHTNILKERYLK